MSPQTRRIVLVLVVALVIAVQHVQRLSAHPAPRPRAAAPPPNQLRLGTLLLQRCEIGRRGVAGVGTADAYCAPFDVPEDWDTPSGRHIRLSVAIVKSTAARSDSDLVTFLDGGPGGAATEDYPALATALKLLRQRRDILLIDQR